MSTELIIQVLGPNVYFDKFTYVETNDLIPADLTYTVNHPLLWLSIVRLY